MKAALRRTIKERLAKLGQSELLAQSQRLLAKLTALPQYQNAQTIALYMSMDNSEIKTDLLVRDALDRGKRVYLPRITHLSKFQDYQRHEKQKSCLHFLEVELNDLEQMKPQGKYQLREPAFNGSDTAWASMTTSSKDITKNTARNRICWELGSQNS
ncbi:hypothetical protein KL925_004845 [Ogataea polymorpha]|nr:hypothetical protein KL925_004845 [Ogataea polymorpha]